MTEILSCSWNNFVSISELHISAGDKCNDPHLACPINGWNRCKFLVFFVIKPVSLHPWPYSFTHPHRRKLIFWVKVQNAIICLNYLCLLTSLLHHTEAINIGILYLFRKILLKLAWSCDFCLLNLLHVNLFYCLHNQGEKARVIQTLLFVAGVNTLLQALFGTRLPAVVGGSFAYVIPVVYIIFDSSLQRISDHHEVSYSYTDTNVYNFYFNKLLWVGLCVWRDSNQDITLALRSLFTTLT